MTSALENPQDVKEAASVERDARIYEYTSAANPIMPDIPVLALDPSVHENGE